MSADIDQKVVNLQPGHDVEQDCNFINEQKTEMERQNKKNHDNLFFSFSSFEP